MSSLKIIMTDDNPGELAILRSILEKIEGAYIVGEAKNAVDTIELVKEQNPDIAFLDIHMPGMNGIELAKKIREIKPSIFIVFITSYKDYIWKADEVFSVAYILKPYKEKRVKLTFNHILQITSFSKASKWIFVKSEDNTREIAIETSKILYAKKEAEGNYIIVYCLDGKEYRIRKKLNDLEKELENSFFRCHRSYIVTLNVEHIEKIVNRSKSSPSYRVTFKSIEGEAEVSRESIDELRARLKGDIWIEKKGGK